MMWQCGSVREWSREIQVVYPIISHKQHIDTHFVEVKLNLLGLSPHVVHRK